MAEVLLSEAERIFVLHGVQDNVRLDGRTSEDYRCIELETDVVSNSNGSARVRLANTDVLVGVKAEIGEPEAEVPEEGRLEFFVDCSANATPAFEGRGGENLASEISSMLELSLRLDLKDLNIITGKQCWVLYVDVLILECGGNLFDTVSMAVKAALYNTKIPVVIVSSGERGEAELELSDDPYDCKRLNIANVPCLVTLNKIGHFHVVDASMEEEACTLGRFEHAAQAGIKIDYVLAKDLDVHGTHNSQIASVSLALLVLGVLENGSITSMRKVGSGSLDPDSVTEMSQSGKRVGQELNKVLMSRLKEEESLGNKRQRKGFLR